MQLRGRLIESVVGEQLVCHSLSCIGHRCGQCLVEVGYGCQQTSRIRKSPVPPGMFREGERQAASLPMATSLWPEQDTTGPGGLTRVGMHDDPPMTTLLLKTRTGSGSREGGSRHHPDRTQPGIPQIHKQATQFAGIRWKQPRAQHASALDNIDQEHLTVCEDSKCRMGVH